MFEDFQEVLAEDRQKRRRLCALGNWLASLPEEHRATAQGLVDNPDHNCRQLAQYFSTKGAKLNDQVINRHRNAQCCGQNV